MAAVNTAPEPETSTKINIAESETADIDDSMADIETAPATNKDFAAADSPVTSVQSDWATIASGGNGNSQHSCSSRNLHRHQQGRTRNSGHSWIYIYHSGS